MTRLPPFFALRALEAAARRRSYSRAAEELSVTHGAVSQQIRRLEAELGARLFDRRGNSMIPTPAAERLAGEVGQALAIMRAGVAAFGDAAELGTLRVSLDPQFAARWLPPRLPRLLADPAGANLELVVDEKLADFVTDGVDVAVRYGPGRWEGVESRPLFVETLIPLCSPGFAQRYPMREVADLLGAPLLHHTHRPWRMWFDEVGLPPPAIDGTVFADSVMLLEAAAQGLGVALARSGLVEEDLRTGRLVAPLERSAPSELSFHVVWRADSRKLKRVEALRDWLVAEAACGAG